MDIVLSLSSRVIDYISAIKKKIEFLIIFDCTLHVNGHAQKAFKITPKKKSNYAVQQQKF